MMRLAFGILLFVLVYAPIAYMVFDELRGRRSRVRTRRPELVREPLSISG
jgi:hypothetical protein